MIKINGDLLPITRPLVMGILNLTKDSFYDGGRYLDIDKAEAQVDRMIAEGADIIDLGAFSSRPGAQLVSASEQLAVLLPIMERLAQSKPKLRLSIDTYSSEVVSELAQIKPFIVNDISGFSYDDKLLATVARLKLPYILMHIVGKPDDMQKDVKYDDVVFDVLNHLAKKYHILRSEGIDDVIIDPGFGFGKLIEHNYQLLAKLEVFSILDCPIMVGLSRKSMIHKPLGITPTESLNGTTALHMSALMHGAKILRVHDVKEAVETVTLWSQLQSHVNKI